MAAFGPTHHISLQGASVPEAAFVDFRDWMQGALYGDEGKSGGYYGGGTVRFAEDRAASVTEGTDFVTFASDKDSILHLVLLDISYRLYSERRHDKKAEPFQFIELSGGNGML